MIVTTRIVVRGEHWDVPRGFGATYKRAVRDDLSACGARKPGEVIELIHDVLALIGYEASVGVIADWPLRKRVEAVVYAATEHARASDNPVRRHPKPDWLPAPWKGMTKRSAYARFLREAPTVLRNEESAS